MTETVYVKPAEGSRIRQPERDGRVMPDVGDLVPRDFYYERLIIGGDVVIAEPLSESKSSSPDPQPPALDAFSSDRGNKD